MRINDRRTFNVIVAGAFILVAVCIVACGGGGDGSRTLKLSLILGDNSDWYRGAERFGELLNDRSGGRWRVRIYPHAQLAGQVQRTELEMLQTGVIDISMESSILLSLIEPHMSVVSLPWLFDDYSEANRILDGPLGRELLDFLPGKGIVGLAYGANGFRQITNSRNPIRTPDDIRSMKVRVPGIRMYIEVFRLLGADPSSMNFGELFTALAQGTMDGQENPLSVILSARLYEVQKYCSVWNYSFDPVILCINKRLWNGLTPEDQNLFSQCAEEAMRFERDYVENGEQAIGDSLRALGMDVIHLDAGERGAFRKLTQQSYRTLADQIGEDLVDRFRAAAEEK